MWTQFTSVTDRQTDKTDRQNYHNRYHATQSVAR